MANARPCPQCGDSYYSEGEKEALHGACPRCIARELLAESSVSAGAGGGFIPLDAGVEFQGYEILGVLGQGGMGVVYRARQKSLGRDVALKILSPRLARSEEFVLRFRREARLLAAITHPNVVRIYEFGEAEGLLYLALELVAGSTLQTALDAKSLRASGLVAVMANVCDGLDRVHRAGLVHRDLKPANIIITPEGEPKIADFGLAVRTEETLDLTETGAVLGTPHYMSPEQGRGLPVDGRSDLYAIGVMLYQGLTGRLPFEGTTPAAVLVKHVGETPPPMEALAPGLPPSLQQLTMRLLSKDPAGRPESAKTLQKRLVNAAGEARDWEQRGGTTSAARPAGRRSSIPWVAVLVLTLAGLTVVLGRIVDRRVAPGPAGSPTLLEAPIEIDVSTVRWDGVGPVQSCGWDSESSRVFLLSNGTVDFPLHLSGGTYEVTVLASGDEGLGIGAEFEVSVSGKVLGRAIAGKSLREYSFQGNLRGGDLTLFVSFLNDAHKEGEYDRNLYIYAIRVRPIPSYAPAPLTPRPPGPSMDLLKRISTDIHTLQGEWVFKGPVLVSTSPPHQPAAIALPAYPADRYELEIVVRPVEPSLDGLTIGLAMGTSRFVATLDGWARPGNPGEATSGISLIGGKNAYSNHTRRDGRFLTVRKESVIHCEVESGSVEIQVDGRRAISWGGYAEALSVEPRLWDLPLDVKLFLGSRTGRYEFHRVTLTSRQGRAVKAPISVKRLPPPDLDGIQQDQPGRVWSLAYSSNGKRVISGGDDGLVRVWEAGTGRLFTSFGIFSKQIESVALSPDGKLACGGSGDRLARIWEVETGVERPHLHHDGTVTCVAFAPDSKRVLTGAGRSMFLWDVGEVKPRRVFDHGGSVYEVGFSPDGSRVLSAGGAEAGIRVWDAATGDLTAELKGHLSEIRGAVFTPDGKGVVSAAQDDSVRIWDVGTKLARSHFTVHGEPARMEGVAISPDGKSIVYNRGDTVLIDAATGIELQRFTGHCFSARRAAFSPDGKTVASCGGDGTVAYWKVREGWTPVFDKKTLEFMRPESRAAWAVEDGDLIRASGLKKDAAQSQAEFGDGQVRISFQVQGLDYLGFQVRQGDSGSYGVTWDATNSPPLGWDNELVFTCQGDDVSATLNGLNVPVDRKGRPATGHIQAQVPDSVKGLRVHRIDHRPFPIRVDRQAGSETEGLLGASPVWAQGLRLVRQADGEYEVANRHGKTGFSLLSNSGANRYLYFRTDDRSAYFTHAEVEVEYYDQGSGAFGLEYEGYSGPYTVSPVRAALQGSATWKTVRFTLDHPVFGGSQNGGADFRLIRAPGADLEIGSVRVRRIGPPDLLRIGPARSKPERTGPGLTFDYYEGTWSRLPHLKSLTPILRGTVPTFELSRRLREIHFAMRFSGLIVIPEDGVYHFWTSSDDGSTLKLQSHGVVYNDGLHPLQERSGSVILSAGLYPIDVSYFQAVAEAKLRVFWDGPSFSRQEIPESVLLHEISEKSADELIGHWTLDDARLVDLSGRSGRAQIIGDVTWEAGRIGAAIKISGPGGRIVFPSPKGLLAPEADSYSIVLWYKREMRSPEAVPAAFPNEGILVRRGWNEGLYVRNDGSFIFAPTVPGVLPAEDADCAVSPKDKVVSGRWHHLAGVQDRQEGKIRLYLDSVLVAENNLRPMGKALPHESPGWVAGPSGVEGFSPLRGLLDDVRIYKRALSHTEIAQLQTVARFEDTGTMPIPPWEDQPANPTVDLLGMIDLQQDGLRGSWTRANGFFQSRLQPFACLQIPYHPPAEYDLYLTVERKGPPESLNLGLSSGEVQFELVLDGSGGQVSGLHLLDGKTATENESTRRVSLFSQDVPTTVLVSVRRGRVKASVGDAVAVDWRGDFSRLSTDPAWKLPDHLALSIGSHETTFAIRDMKLTPVSGSGQRSR